MQRHAEYRLVIRFNRHDQTAHTLNAYSKFLYCSPWEPVTVCRAAAQSCPGARGNQGCPKQPVEPASQGRTPE